MMAEPCSQAISLVVLNENSLWYLLNELNEIRVKWKYIGLGLGVSQSDLDAMKGSPLECLRCMLTEWLKGINPQPSLDTLIKVLKEPVVNERKKAKELEENFRCSFSTTVTDGDHDSISTSPSLQGCDTAPPSEEEDLRSVSASAEISEPEPEGQHDDPFISSRVRPSLWCALDKIDDPDVKKKLKHKDHQFRTLVRKTRRYLSTKIKTKEEFDDFKVAVTLMPSSLDGHHLLLPADDRSVIIGATEIAPIFVVLNQYWTFVQYELLEYVVQEFGNFTLKREMKGYVTDMDKLEKEIGIGHVTAVQLCYPRPDSVPVEVHLSGTQHTLGNPRFIQRAMAKQQELHPHTVRTYRTIPGSMIITLLIPYSVAGHVLATLHGMLPAKDFLSRPLEQRMVYKIQGAETEPYLPMGPSKETTAAEERQQSVINIGDFLNVNQVIEVTMSENYEIVARNKLMKPKTLLEKISAKDVYSFTDEVFDVEDSNIEKMADIERGEEGSLSRACDSFPSEIVKLLNDQVSVEFADEFLDSMFKSQLQDVEQDYAFIDGEQASQFMCPITSDLLLKPHQTRCCGKIISEAALNRLETNQCPFCKEKEITTTLDKHFQRQVREIQVFCSYRKSGCEWTGEVSSLPAHINSCPKKNSPSIQQLGVGILNMDNAVTVLDQLLPLANFSYQLGLALKLSKEVVDQIHAEHQKAPDRLRHIIQIFLSNTQPPPTWRAIIEALQAPGLSRFQLANEIKKKFISPVDGNTATAEVIQQTEEFCEEVNFRMPDYVAELTGIRLGFGTYSEVLEVLYKHRKYAAKVYRQIEAEAVIASCSRERQILSMIRHRNNFIVSYYGTCKLKSGDTTAIILERMDKNLSMHLDNSKLVLTQKLRILNDVAQGLAFLHSQRPPIVHRDLNATNILLDSNMVSKLADFGNSVLIDNEIPCLLTPFPGTADYMPPEAADGDYNEKLDVFSFGHLSIYVFNQQQPCPLLQYTYVQQGKVFGRSEIERRGRYLNKVVEYLDKDDNNFLYLTLHNCLQNDPKLRPSVKDIIDSGVLLIGH